MEETAKKLKSITKIGIRTCRKALKASEGDIIGALYFLNSIYNINLVYDIFITENNSWEF